MGSELELPEGAAHIRTAIMPWNRILPPTEAKKRQFFSRPKVSWELVEQPSSSTSSAASDVPASKTKIQVLPVDGSFQKKSEYQQQQEEQQQELLEDMAKEVVAAQLTQWWRTKSRWQPASTPASSGWPSALHCLSDYLHYPLKKDPAMKLYRNIKESITP